MAKRYARTAPDERYYVKAWLKAGDSQAEIARWLGRSPSTVSRELKRNAGPSGYRPKQISGCMRLEGGPCVSHQTVYRFLWRGKRNDGDLHTHLRQSAKKRRKRCGKNDFRGRISDRVDVFERPDIVEERARSGDWEGTRWSGPGTATGW